MTTKTTRMKKKEMLPYKKNLEKQRALLAGDINHMEEEALKKNRQESCTLRTSVRITMSRN